MADDNVATVREYFRCLNSEDWTSLEKIWHEEATLHAVGARLRSGRPDILAYFPKIFSVWAAHHDEPVRIISADSSVTVEVAFTGQTLDGSPVAFDALDLFDIEDGLIVRLVNWYDLGAARAALAGTR